MKLNIAVPATLALSLSALPAAALDFGGEVRRYPSGVIVGGKFDVPLDAGLWLSGSASYDFADRGNNGEHQDESGGGGGIGATLDWYLDQQRGLQEGWFVGVRTEVFFLNIDWNDPGRSGSTDVTVFQPTARGGYAWAFDHGHYGLQLGASLGAEINVKTNGEKVGEGAILLGGAAFTFQP
jgi:hypothetical protein